MAAAMRLKMFSWGANSYGQLAQNHKDDLLLPTRTRSVDSNIQTIYGGGGHTLILDEENRMWACGSNSKCQLGEEDTNDVPRPLVVNILGETKISKLACGWDFSVALSEDGKVFSWGSNSFGQLGTDSRAGSRAHAVQIQLHSDTRVIDICAGLRHAGAITDSGRVFMWGSGKKGQLGILQNNKPFVKLPSASEVTTPNDESDQICQIVAGAYHTAVLTKKGNVIIWGENKHGQITKDPADTSIQYTPYIVPMHHFQSRVTRLYTGWTHVLALTENGLVYSWGRNDYGQLGRNYGVNFKPDVIIGVNDPQDICCGSEHNLLLTHEHRLMSWGWNEHGMCGSGSEKDIPLPTLIEVLQHEKVVSIGCGMGHSFCIAEQ